MSVVRLPEYETEFEHLVENGDHAQYHPDDGRNHSGGERPWRGNHIYLPSAVRRQ